MLQIYLLLLLLLLCLRLRPQFSVFAFASIFRDLVWLGMVGFPAAERPQRRRHHHHPTGAGLRPD